MVRNFGGLRERIRKQWREISEVIGREFGSKGEINRN